MNRILALLLISLLLTSTNAFSQTDTTKTKHQKAITFSFSGLNLGGAISGRLWLNDEYCFRLGIDGLYKAIDDTPPQADSLYHQINSRDTHYGFALGIEKHFPVTDNISPYLGLDIGVEHVHGSYDYIFLKQTTTSHYTNNTYNGSIFIGVEYWLSRTFSIAGEHSISISYYKGEDYNTVDIENSTSALMLSIYF